MADLIAFAVDTAMRLSEIINLKWIDLNEADKTIIIRNRKHPGAGIGNDQEVPLLGESFEIIKRQPRTDKEGRTDFPVTEGTVSSLFPRTCKALGAEDIRFHDLRHEFSQHNICCSRSENDFKRVLELRNNFNVGY
nr:tyrosine-type recombinase/integrase [uncultured Herbaspirillum sp.]